MSISKVRIQNYRCLKDVTINFQRDLNIIVGDNDVGKSSVLEAINLALTGMLNGRSIYSERHQFLFNREIVEAYLSDRARGSKALPPNLEIEIFFHEEDDVQPFRGSINSLKEDATGIRLAFEFDKQYWQEFEEHLDGHGQSVDIPIDYFKIIWRSFADGDVNARAIQRRSVYIDAADIKSLGGTSKFVLEMMEDKFDRKERLQLSVSYRAMRDQFSSDARLKKFNQNLAEVKGSLTDRNMGVALDSSSRLHWENVLETQLDGIPLAMAGKGEQSSVKIKLAMQSGKATKVFLLEEPENHLSHSNLNALISSISNKSEGKQLILTTHSSFVLNKLGLDNVILFTRNGCASLSSLKPDTKDYFLKLPGHDTLRLILSRKVILVEGPSDELIVMKAFKAYHGMLPLEKSVDVISVKSLAFKRFLEIAELLKVSVVVVTDNDGKVEKVKSKYKEFAESKHIRFCFDENEKLPTLEPQICAVNDLSMLNRIFQTKFEQSKALEEYMGSNKTDCALAIFNSDEAVKWPQYIMKAVA